MSNSKENKSSDPQGISSLELGLYILDTISASPKSMSLTELADKVDMKPSRLYKYMVSLTRSGYIQKDQNTNNYTLHTASMRLGISALRLIDPVKLAFKTAEQLHQKLDKTISLTIWNGNGPLVIKWLDSSQLISVNVRVGAELSPFSSASGRVFLAFLPIKRSKKIIDDYYTKLPAPPRYLGEELQKEEFISLLDGIRKEKICRFSGDFLPDINVVSAPIFDNNGQISSVISLLGMTSDTPILDGSLYEREVSEAAIKTTQCINGQV